MVQAALAILVIDGDAMVRHALRRQLEAGGFTVQVAEDGTTALTLLALAPVDIVLAEIDLRAMEGGGDLLDQVGLRCPRALRVLMTSRLDLATPPALPLLEKPFHLDQLKQLLRTFAEPPSGP